MTVLSVRAGFGAARRGQARPNVSGHGKAWHGFPSLGLAPLARFRRVRVGPGRAGHGSSSRGRASLSSRRVQVRQRWAGLDVALLGQARLYSPRHGVSGQGAVGQGAAGLEWTCQDTVRQASVRLYSARLDVARQVLATKAARA